MGSARRGIIAVLTLLALMVGCAGERGQPNEPEATAGERVVNDSTGEVRIPTDVDRIVTLHHIGTQPLTDLGVVPAGRGPVDEEMVVPETWDTLKDIPVTADNDGPDIEAIAQLDPGLIIGHNRIDPEVLDKLRELAPVLVLDIAGAGRTDWQAKVALVAEALGKEDAYQQLLQEYEEKAAEIAASHEETLAEETFALVGSWNAGTIIAFGSKSNYGRVFAQAGASIAPAEEEAVADESEQEVELSQEQAPDVLDGTVVLHQTDLRGKPNAELVAVMESPVFRNVPAVREGKVHPGGKGTVGGFEDARYNLELFDAALSEIADG